MNEYLPIDDIMKSDMLRDYYSTQPKKVDPASTTFFYYVETLFRKAQSIYEFKGMPEKWDYDYFVSILLSQGFITVTNTPLGVLPLRCGISGINVFNHPTKTIIANPVIGNLERTIDEDCTLIKLQYNYRSIMDIIYKYATMLAECDGSIAVNLMNSKVTFIAFCNSKAQSETMKAMYSEISKAIHPSSTSLDIFACSIAASIKIGTSFSSNLFVHTTYIINSPLFNNTILSV